MENSAVVTIHQLLKQFPVGGDFFTALKNITLTFAKRGFTGLVGPSGSGKTTLLNIIDDDNDEDKQGQGHGWQTSIWENHLGDGDNDDTVPASRCPHVMSPSLQAWGLAQRVCLPWSPRGPMLSRASPSTRPPAITITITIT